jgi:hypothetical protein
MVDSLLLLLLALGGREGAPAASPGLAPATAAVAPVTGIWRGNWLGRGGRTPLPVDAVLAPGKASGTLIAVIVAGIGRERRSARLSGQYEPHGAHLALPSGGAVRLNLDRGRLVGEVTGSVASGLVPGDGVLELDRVRR